MQNSFNFILLIIWAPLNINTASLMFLLALSFFQRYKVFSHFLLALMELAISELSWSLSSLISGDFLESLAACEAFYFVLVLFLRESFLDCYVSFPGLWNQQTLRLFEKDPHLWMYGELNSNGCHHPGYQNEYSVNLVYRQLISAKLGTINTLHIIQTR